MTALLTALAKCGFVEEALAFLRSMDSFGLKGDVRGSALS